ncbi:hypothetical protein BpHYR1_003069 [Brachionus plicatilis]|uniref:Uncharacterized protein n=1 Tax=Brachionus plicatilis TaxID=10195 RepID=A0A3M7SED6_BRAPC|nr:hypothetical protein BpHYR1_003069 [Brachionus plicatilis]
MRFFSNKTNICYLINFEIKSQYCSEIADVLKCQYKNYLNSNNNYKFLYSCSVDGWDYCNPENVRRDVLTGENLAHFIQISFDHFEHQILIINFILPNFFLNDICQLFLQHMQTTARLACGIDLLGVKYKKKRSGSRKNFLGDLSFPKLLLGGGQNKAATLAAKNLDREVGRLKK